MSINQSFYINIVIKQPAIVRTLLVRTGRLTILEIRIVWDKGQQPMACVPSVVRETIFSGTLSELKYIIQLMTLRIL